MCLSTLSKSKFLTPLSLSLSPSSSILPIISSSTSSSTSTSLSSSSSSPSHCLFHSSLSSPNQRYFSSSLSPSFPLSSLSSTPIRSFSSRSSTPAASPSPSPSSSSSSTPSSSVDAVYQTPCGLWVDPSLPRTFTKVLIANRGEIACRVIRTCKELGISTVAVYSEVDRHARHVQMADEAFLLGEAAAKDSYLKGEKILEIAKQCGAQAIHPGYGFLSENSAFAKQCEDNGIEFIGPPGSAIEAMGSKSGSKIIMTKANVPVVPGYWGNDQSPEGLKKEAKKVGYPVMLKAVSGGGGKGMRIVHNEDEFLESLESCKREAFNSFKDDRVLIERYIIRPRHIEFQVFADKKGNAVYFYERECSCQRRHQKVLEEAPAPGMTDKLRQEMGNAAVMAAKAVGYVGAGTVEFIFDAETGEYFFMEMNTRLQVEHPVTEMIIRRDLVQLQLHVAAGHPLPVKQEQIVAYGHAIEARVYAENPHNNFLPATGHLIHLSPPPTNNFTRVESGVRQGDSVSIFYDPMIAKLVIWGPSRTMALQRMKNALLDYQIVGPPNNIQFLRKCISHPKFIEGMIETNFIPQNLRDLVPLDIDKKVVQKNKHLAVLSLLLRESSCSSATSPNSISSHPITPISSNPFHNPNSFRVNQSHPTRQVNLHYAHYNKDGEMVEDPLQCEVKYSQHENRAHVNHSQWYVDEEKAEGILTWEDSTRTSALIKSTIGSQSYNYKVVFTPSSLHIFLNGDECQFHIPQVTFEGLSAHSAALSATAPMAGKIVKMAVSKGNVVKKGQQLVVMEAMKMEHIIRAQQDGVVGDILYKAGDFVEGGKPLIKFEVKKETETKK